MAKIYCCDTDEYVDPVNFWNELMWDRLGKDDKGEMGKFRMLIVSFFCEWYMKNLYKVHAVSKV